MTVNDILDRLEDETHSDNKEVQITLFPPPTDAIDSNGDSDDEETPTCSFSHLSRKLLEAEGEIAGEADKTCDSQDEIEEDLVVFPSTSSSKPNNNNNHNNNSRKEKTSGSEVTAGNICAKIGGNKVVKKSSGVEAKAAKIGGKKVVKKSSAVEAKIGGKKVVKKSSGVDTEAAKIGGKKVVKKSSGVDADADAETAEIGGKKVVKKSSENGRSSYDELPLNGGGDVFGAPILAPAMRKSVAKKLGAKNGDKKNGAVRDKENLPPPDIDSDFDLMPPPPAVMRSMPAGRGRRKEPATVTSSGQASPSDDSDDDEDLARALSAKIGSTVRLVPVKNRGQTGKKSRTNEAKSSESKSGHDENARGQKRKVTTESESDYDENISRRRRTRSQGDVDDEEEDDEENNSKQGGRKGNPEYNRVWSDTDMGVGSKIGEFDPPPNASESEEVKNIKSPYDAWRLFLPDEFIQEVLEQSRIYAHQEGFGRKASDVTKDNLLCVLAVMLLSG